MLSYFMTVIDSSIVITELTKTSEDLYLNKSTLSWMQNAYVLGVLEIKEVFKMNITEVSKKFEISAETLRYYERIGLIPKVHRDKNGYRDYTEQDQLWVYYAKALRQAGVSIEAMTEYIALVQEGEHTRRVRKEILLIQEKQLEENIKNMQEALEYLRKKINVYDDYILKYEQGLSRKNKDGKE